MKTIKIEAKRREDLGKAATKQLRRKKMVPGVLYGGDGENIHFYAHYSAFTDLVLSPSFVTATLVIDGKEYEAIVKEEQYHPLSDALMHIDFHELTPGKPVITEIPIRTEGRSVGVLDGGKLLTKVRKLKVRATPEHLREYITVDVTDLDINKSIKVGELNELLKGMDILTPASVPVATVVTPRALKSAAMKAAKDAGLLPEEEGAAGAAAAEGAAAGEGEAQEGAE